MIRKKVRRNPTDGVQSLEELNRIRKEQYLKKKAMLQDLVNAQKKDIPIQYIILIKQYEDETFDEIYVALDPMLHIFSFLNPHDLLLKVGLVCKSWYFLSIRTNFLWQSLYYKEFGDVQARPIHTALLDEDDEQNFDGHWMKVFSFRVDLRNKWYHNSPDRIGYCDIMESEIVKSSRAKYTNKGDLFRKDAHTACVGEDELPGIDSEHKKLYRVNPEDRSTITSMCLIGSDRLLAGDARGVIKLFNLRSFQQVKKFVGAHQTSVHKIVAITPEHLKHNSDNMSVLGYSFKLESTHHYFLSNDFHNSSICVWDLETGLLLKRFRGTDKVHSVSGSSTFLNGNILDMRICTISEYGPVLIVITPKNVEIYELNTLRLLKLYRPFYEPKKHEIVTKKLIDAAIENFDKDDIEEQPEEQDDDNFDDDTGMNQPAKSIVCFELLDNSTFAFISGDMKLYVYNLNHGICIKTMDMKHTKMLDIDNYNRPTSVDSFKKKYNKFKESDVLITQIAKTATDGQIALVLSLRPSDYDGYSPLKSYIKYFDYRFGCENIVKSCQIGNYDYYSSGKIFFDEDKIIQCTQSNIQLLGRSDGTLKQELLPTLNAAYFTIANFIADDRFLIMGTSFGGIVINDFGGNLLYWSDLKGRKLVDEEQKQEDKMDDSQD